MKNASQYRALASLCRQQAAYNPHLSWQLLGQAERWEHLAANAISDHFRACNTVDSWGVTKPDVRHDKESTASAAA
jgi:hypothetical protein